MYAVLGTARVNADIVLFGRNSAVLESVVAYGCRQAARVGVRVTGTTDLAAALEGADIVVVQIRFGGLEARAEDERLAAEIGCPADETLGPCGLTSGLRQVRPIEELSAEIRAKCPAAFLINMMNPLSLTTGIMARCGLNVVGVCELPILTLRKFAHQLQCDPCSLTWNYTGLNHRGFLFGIKKGDVDLIDLFAASEIPAPDGLERADILQLDAVPLKYFRQFKLTGSSGIGRARELTELRNELTNALLQDPTRRPERLGDRAMPWYDDAIVPVLAAWLMDRSADITLNFASSDGIVREQRVRVAAKCIHIVESKIAERPIAEWIARFEYHEQLSIRALASPSIETIEAALRADMITPEGKIEIATNRILESYHQMVRAKVGRGGAVHADE